MPGDGAQRGSAVVPRVTSELRRRIRAVAWRVGFERDRVLATVILPAEEFEHGAVSASTLVKAIQAEGVAA